MSKYKIEELVGGNFVVYHKVSLYWLPFFYKWKEVFISTNFWGAEAYIENHVSYNNSAAVKSISYYDAKGSKEYGW